MKNKKFILAALLGSCVSFIVVVSLDILFEKWHVFNIQKSSFESKIIEAAFASVFLFFWFLYYSKRRLKRVEKNKN